MAVRNYLYFVGKVWTEKVFRISNAVGHSLISWPSAHILMDRPSISAVKFWIRALKRWQLSPDASECTGYCFDLKQASLDISGAHLLAEATLSFPQGIQTAKRRSGRPQKPCLLSDQGKYGQVEEMY
jgi:hypothetical protein